MVRKGLYVLQRKNDCDFQFCLSHIPSYFLSVYKALTLVAIRIEKMQRDFPWSRFREGKRDHVIRWD